MGQASRKNRSGGIASLLFKGLHCAPTQQYRADEPSLPLHEAAGRAFDRDFLPSIGTPCSIPAADQQKILNSSALLPLYKQQEIHQVAGPRGSSVDNSVMPHRGYATDAGGMAGCSGDPRHSSALPGPESND